MEYLHWDEQTITDFSDKAVAAMYDRGYVFTRKGRGVMQQTRSCRIDLSKFELSSENRRILKKISGLKLESSPIPYVAYSWQIGKLAKDFYVSRDAEFSANKVKGLITDASTSSFNTLLRYDSIGYAISYKSDTLLHYSYPFYDLTAPRDTGLGMMLLAIQYAKEKRLKYTYLGSLQRPSDTYKLQFSGLEWFDGEKWQADTAPLKEILK